MNQPTVTSYPLSDFLQWRASGQLTLNPRFQRRSVWVDKARSYLIDTLLRRMPIPALYIRSTFDPKRTIAVRDVVDGQQRLRAIFDFIEGRFEVLAAHNREFGGKRYTDFSDEKQREFLQYKLPVNLLEEVNERDVLDIFARINTYTVPLNAQELRNSRYFGRFKSLVYELAHSHYGFWVNHRILTDYKIARMSDAELVSILVVTMLDGIRQTKKKDLDSAYARYDDSFPSAEKCEAEFRETIDTIGDGFSDRLGATEFRRLPLFYSLFVFFYDALHGLPGSTRRLGRRRVTAELRSWCERLEDVSATVASDEAMDSDREFVEATRLSTADVGKRMLRHDYLWRKVVGTN